MNDNLVILSVGGSLVAPKAIDIEFLKKFKKFIIDQTGQGRRFIIISGGGDTAREYQKVAREISTPTNDELDWLGIGATRLNANLLRVVFSDLAHEVIVTADDQEIDFKESVLVAGGFRPGRSTDYIAVSLASRFGVKKIINLTNIDKVFDKDPALYPDAVPLERITWDDFRKIIPAEYSPGSHTPFDPEASKLAQSLGLEVAVINGKNFDRLTDYLGGKYFVGTVIS